MGGSEPAPAHLGARELFVAHATFVARFLARLGEVVSSDPAAAVGLAAEDDARARAFLDLHPKSPFAAIVRGVLAP